MKALAPKTARARPRPKKASSTVKSSRPGWEGSAGTVRPPGSMIRTHQKELQRSSVKVPKAKQPAFPGRVNIASLMKAGGIRFK